MRVDWTSPLIDWSKADWQIGMTLNVSRNHVCQMRKRYNKPKPAIRPKKWTEIYRNRKAA